MNDESELLDEESIIEILWANIGETRRDPFDDDAAWERNQSDKRFLVSKADMFVASTDAPPQMSAAQMAKKSIVSCVSDLAAKGVCPTYCLVSLGLPKKLTTREFVASLAAGFTAAESEYGLKIIGGDTNATSQDIVIDCSIFGFANSLVLRKGARPGDLVGVSGQFGAQPAGLLILLGKAKSSNMSFEKKAVNLVLEPRARVDVGLRARRFLSSCIDSSDGLAISLYHVAESSKVSFRLEWLPVHPGVENFASENNLRADDLVLFGGEEYELICTFPEKSRSAAAKLGIEVIGTVVENKTSKSEVYLDSELVARKGWLHFKS